MAKSALKTTGAETVAWDLSDLYAGVDDPQIERDLADVQRRADLLSKDYRGHVAKLDDEQMHDLIQRLEAIIETVQKAQDFAYLEWTTDTESATRGALLQKVTEEGSRLSQKLVFIELEWAHVPEKAAKALMKRPVLKHYQHWLELARRYRPHLLSEPEEKLLTEKAVTGRDAWARYFGEVMGAARYELDGEMVPEHAVISRLHDADRSTRQRAAASLTSGLRGLSRTTTYIFNILLADKASDDRLRHYERWISSRNLGNEVDDEMVEALINAVTSHYSIVNRYYRLKRSLLGLNELFDYDRYAPLPAADKHYQWQDAQQIVLSAYGKFHPLAAEIAGMFFDKHWIDAAVRPGKLGGAYSSGTVPSVHPYIFMNYEGTPWEVMTLAHELGHGIHQWLSREQGVLQASTPLTTAETASVFGEMLVFDDLMSQEADPQVRLAMLTSKIEDTFGTTFRQISLNRFEDAVHNARRTEGELTTDRFSELWLGTQRAMFTDSVTMTDDYGIWWSYIPHFLQTPGYVYAYAFGNLLVLALYARYRETGSAFAEKYLNMLRAGSTDWPHNIVKPLGINLNDPQFWEQGLDLVNKMVREAEELATQVNSKK